MNANSTLKSLIASIKKDEKLLNVTCAYGNSKKIASVPVASFLLCCSVGESEIKTDNSPGKASFDFSLFAPTKAGGKELSEISQRIISLWKEESRTLQIEKITCSNVKYHSNLATVYVEIRVDAAKQGAGEIWINNSCASGILEYTCSKDSAVSFYKELFCGEQEYVGKSVYAVKIKSSEPLDFSEDFSFSVKGGSEQEVFGGCTLKSEKQSFKDGKLVYEYQLEAQQRYKTDAEVKNGQQSE